MLNFDANASVPPSDEAKKALCEAVQFVGNPSSPHALGRGARVVLDKARLFVSQALGCLEKELFFTSGATEGNRWCVDAVIQTSRQAKTSLRVVTTPFEHASLAKPLLKAAGQGDIVLTTLRVNKKGDFQLEEVDWSEVDVLFMTAAHNESGKMPHWSEVLNHLHPQTILISDAAQSFARGDVLPKRIDGIVVSAHKMGAFSGVGAVLWRANAKRLQAPWPGGGQEGGLRPGTESVALIHAFGVAAAHIEKMRVAHQELGAMRDFMEQALLEAWPHAQIVAGEGSRLPNTCALMLHDINGDALRIAIDLSGVCVGFGSACSALAPEPSSALLALGFTLEQAQATIRLSLVPHTTQQDVMHALERLVPIGKQLAGQIYR